MSLYGDMKAIQSQDEAVWRALGDPTRRALLDRLALQPRTTGDLVAAFPQLCRTAVMKHLDVLAQARLILVKRQGRTRWNHLNPVPIEKVLGRWLDGHRQARSQSLLRLKQIAETPEPKGTSK